MCDYGYGLYETLVESSEIIEWMHVSGLQRLDLCLTHDGRWCKDK